MDGGDRYGTIHQTGTVVHQSSTFVEDRQGKRGFPFCFKKGISDRDVHQTESVTLKKESDYTINHDFLEVKSKDAEISVSSDSKFMAFSHKDVSIVLSMPNGENDQDFKSRNPPFSDESGSEIESNHHYFSPDSRWLVRLAKMKTKNIGQDQESSTNSFSQIFVYYLRHGKKPKEVFSKKIAQEIDQDLITFVYKDRTVHTLNSNVISNPPDGFILGYKLAEPDLNTSQTTNSNKFEFKFVDLKHILALRKHIDHHDHDKLLPEVDPLRQDQATQSKDVIFEDVHLENSQIIEYFASKCNTKFFNNPQMLSMFEMPKMPGTPLMIYRFNYKFKTHTEKSTNQKADYTLSLVCMESFKVANKEDFIGGQIQSIEDGFKIILKNSNRVYYGELKPSSDNVKLELNPQKFEKSAVDFSCMLIDSSQSQTKIIAEDSLKTCIVKYFPDHNEISKIELLVKLKNSYHRIYELKLDADFKLATAALTDDLKFLILVSESGIFRFKYINLNPLYTKNLYAELDGLPLSYSTNDEEHLINFELPEQETIVWILRNEIYVVRQKQVGRLPEVVRKEWNLGLTIPLAKTSKHVSVQDGFILVRILMEFEGNSSNTKKNTDNKQKSTVVLKLVEVKIKTMHVEDQKTKAEHIEESNVNIECIENKLNLSTAPCLADEWLIYKDKSKESNAHNIIINQWGTEDTYELEATPEAKNAIASKTLFWACKSGNFLVVGLATKAVKVKDSNIRPKSLVILNLPDQSDSKHIKLLGTIDTESDFKQIAFFPVNKYNRLILCTGQDIFDVDLQTGSLYTIVNKQNLFVKGHNNVKIVDNERFLLSPNQEVLAFQSLKIVDDTEPAKNTKSVVYIYEIKSKKLRVLAELFRNEYQNNRKLKAQNTDINNHNNFLHEGNEDEKVQPKKNEKVKTTEEVNEQANEDDNKLGIIPSDIRCMSFDSQSCRLLVVSDLEPEEDQDDDGVEKEEESAEEIEKRIQLRQNRIQINIFDLKTNSQLYKFEENRLSKATFSLGKGKFTFIGCYFGTETRSRIACQVSFECTDNDIGDVAIHVLGLDRNAQLRKQIGNSSERIKTFINFTAPWYISYNDEIVAQLLVIQKKDSVEAFVKQMGENNLLSKYTIMSRILKGDASETLAELLLKHLQNMRKQQLEYPLVNSKAFHEAIKIQGNNIFSASQSLTDLICYIMMAPYLDYMICQLKSEDRAVAEMDTKSLNSDLISRQNALDESTKCLFEDQLKHGKNYQPYRSLVRLDIDKGTEFSMQLWHKLDELPDHHLKTTVKPLVYHKWSTLYPYVLAYSFVNWAAAGLAYIFYFKPESIGVGIALLFFLFLLALFEVLCLSNNPSIYFSKKSNLADAFILSVNFAVCILLIAKVDYNIHAIAWSQCVSIVSLWIRALTWLRVFKGTRYLITMVLQVFFDFIPFMVIFSCAVMIFAFFWRQSDQLTESPVSELNSFFQSVIDSVYIIFGETPEAEYETPIIKYFILLFGNLLLALIFNNLMIATVNNTFMKIHSNKDLYDVKELLEVITDFDALFQRQAKWKKERQLNKRRKIREKKRTLEISPQTSIANNKPETKADDKQKKKSVKELQNEIVKAEEKEALKDQPEVAKDDVHPEEGLRQNGEAKHTDKKEVEKNSPDKLINEQDEERINLKSPEAEKPKSKEIQNDKKKAEELKKHNSPVIAKENSEEFDNIFGEEDLDDDILYGNYYCSLLKRKLEDKTIDESLQPLQVELTDALSNIGGIRHDNELLNNSYEVIAESLKEATLRIANNRKIESSNHTKQSESLNKMKHTWSEINSLLQKVKK